MTTHEDFGIVFIQGTLVVTDSRHVLDDNGVIRMLILSVQDAVCGNHIVNNVGLRDFLGAELLLGAQVLSIVVAEMVVACNRSQFDTSIDQEINQGGLHLSLSRLEIITTNESAVLLSKLNGARNKGILGRSVDERSVFQSAGNRKDGGGRNLFMALLDSLKQVLSSIVHTRDDVSITFGIGCPENDYLIEIVLSFEVSIKQVSVTLHAINGGTRKRCHT